MMKYYLVAAMAVLGIGCAPAGSDTTPKTAAPSTNRQTFEVRGVVEEVKIGKRQVVIQHEEIPDYMPAMTMPFDVKNTNQLAGLTPGDQVAFTMIVTDEEGWIENIRKIGISTNQSPPAERSRIRLVRDVEPLGVGDKMPDYVFTNSLGKRIQLGDFKGQAYAFTFIFTRCPFPNFCPRMSSHFSRVCELMRQPGMPTNWHLISISFDPDYDTPERLQKYSQIYNPDPEKWDWATGAMIDIDAIAEQVGLVFAFENNTFNHNLRTVVVDANGVIRQIFIGNEWKPEELAEELAAGAKGEPIGTK